MPEFGRSSIPSIAVNGWVLSHATANRIIKGEVCVAWRYPFSPIPSHQLAMQLATLDLNIAGCNVRVQPPCADSK
jgi:hypothetical protein